MSQWLTKENGVQDDQTVDFESDLIKCRLG